MAVASSTPAVEVEVPGARRARPGPRGAGEQPRPGLLPGPRRDQARPRRVLPLRRRRHRARAAASGRACCTASPTGVSGEKVHQKRVPRGRPPWLETVRLHFPRYDRTADELCVTELGAGDLGGADVHRRVPPLEQPARRHREARRVAHRPRPGAAVRLRDACGGSPTSCTRCSTSWGRSGWPKTSGGKGMHVYVRIPPDHGFTDVRRAALAFAREVERRAPDDVTTTWWRKDRDPRAPLRRLQPEHARPHHRRGLLGARQPRGHRVDADPLGRGRRRRAAGLHDRDRAGALRRARRPARRDRRGGLRPRPAARVGRPRRGPARRREVTRRRAVQSVRCRPSSGARSRRSVSASSGRHTSRSGSSTSSWL